MKSRANFKGHPIHPMLVGFPIAFFTGALVFDIIAATGNERFFQTGYYLVIAGLITAVAAAVPGIIDFICTVPPASSGKRRALKHGLTNVGVLVMFGAALWVRSGSDDANTGVFIALESVGFILLSFAGWMGGTLVYRNQIGVNPRYANAGKWKEEFVTDSNGLVEIRNVSEVQTNQMKLLHVKGKRIVFAKSDDGYVAFDDFCTHRGGSLAGGSMICGTVQCPWHGSQFDVRNGSVKAGPAEKGIKTYPIKIIDDRYFLNLGG